MNNIPKQKLALEENPAFLSDQILTYLGNKRSLLTHIGEEIEEIQKKLNKKKLITLDVFSGSGIVARFLKQYSSAVYANDLEEYSWIINSCYLANKYEFSTEKYLFYLGQINALTKKHPITGIVTTNYAPQETDNIMPGERAFYTHENAQYIDSVRYYIDKVVPEDYRKFFLARLLIEASIHANTAGVFKGFYKDKITGIGRFGGTAENALIRIKGGIDMSPPVLSSFDSEYRVYKEDANELAKHINYVDVAYLDPPYNQHPYGSNYFMLNLILNNRLESPISKVAGIPEEWNRSLYNKKSSAFNALKELIETLNARFIVVSYNNEGFISQTELKNMMGAYGNVKVKAIEYNTYRGSRNLNNRSLKTNEFIFVLEKETNRCLEMY